MAVNETTLPKGSGFVTVLGVSFLILGLASVLIAGLQFLLVLAFVDQEAVRAGMQAHHNVEKLPEIIRLVLSNLRLLTGSVLAGSVLLTVASVGLLRRRNWARWLFVGFMALAVAGHLAPLFTGSVMLESTLELLTGATGAGTFARGAWIVFVAVSVALALLFAWIGWKLLTPAIAAEFRSG